MNKNFFVFKDGVKVNTGNIKLNEQQMEALQLMANFYFDKNSKSFGMLGYAGTGKTTCVKFLVQYLESKKASISIVFAAPTHRASFVLKSNVRRDVRTLHSILGLQPNMNLDEFDAENIKFDKKANYKLSDLDDLLIIDEASMINDELYDFIMKTTSRNGIKVIFLGDPKQLKPVKQKERSKSLYNNDNIYTLTQVERTGSNALLQEITTVRNSENEKCFTFKNNVVNKNGVIFKRDVDEFLEVVKRMFTSKLFKEDKLFGKIMVATNKSVTNYNDYCRNLIYNDNKEYHIGEVLMGYNTFGGNYFTGPSILNSGDYELTYLSDIVKKTIYGVETFGYYIKVKDLYTKFESEELYILSRDNSDETFEDLGLVFEELRCNAIKKRTNDHSNKGWAEFFNFCDSFMTPKSIKYNGIIKIPKTLDYGYAITIHKSQGGQFNTVLIDDKDIHKAFYSDKEILQQLKYVGISRAKNMCVILH